MSTVAPIYNPDGMWQIWNWKDIYTGPNGTGQYVPKVGDEIHQIVNSTLSRHYCAAVDTATMLPTILPLTEIDYSTSTQPADVLFGTTPETYRVLYDTSVTPARLVVDGRLSVHRATAQGCKIFLGTNTTSSGTVISAYYDSNGSYVSDTLPMELVAVENGQNYGTKSPVPGWTTARLTQGDVVTAVLYDGSNTPLSFKELIVVESGFVRSLNASSKTVVGISLLTPFLSVANNSLINFPVNLPISSLNLEGVVSYNDGSTAKFAVDGTRFSVAGLENFSPTVVGQTCGLTLKYTLQPGENAIGASGVTDRIFAQNYTLVTTRVEGSYSVQLYCYPVWGNNTTGYSLKWFMYDLDRSVTYDVSGLVQVDSTTAYNPTLYGTKQTLKVYLNLKNVNALYNAFVHTQNVDLVLNSMGTYRPINGAINVWSVSQQAGQVPMFGKGVHATYFQQTVASSIVRLNGDYSTYSEWLNAYYTLTRPLFDPATESTAPEPTHFDLVIGSTTLTFTVAQWNAPITVNQSLTNNTNVYLRFFQRTSTRDLQLSIAALPLWQIDAAGSYV